MKTLNIIALILLLLSTGCSAIEDGVFRPNHFKAEIGKTTWHLNNAEVKYCNGVLTVETSMQNIPSLKIDSTRLILTKDIDLIFYDSENNYYHLTWVGK